MDTGTKERVMVAEKRAAALPAQRPEQQNNRAESITPEPTPATCGTCKAVEGLYILGSGFLCVGCIGAAVSIAANDLWPDMVRYSREFEAVLM